MAKYEARYLYFEKGSDNNARPIEIWTCHDTIREATNVGVQQAYMGIFDDLERLPVDIQIFEVLPLGSAEPIAIHHCGYILKLLERKYENMMNGVYHDRKV